MSTQPNIIHSIESAVVLEESKRNNITIEGLLEHTAEDFDKAGRPYVKGIISDKGLQLGIKCWQTDLASFRKRLNLDDAPVVVNLTGKIDVYNDVMSFIVNENAYNSVVEKDIASYIYAAPYKPEKMYGSILKMVNEMKNPFYRGVCLGIMEKFKNKFLLYPYNTTIHTERSGLIYHIYLCLCKVSNLAGMPIIGSKQSKIDEELVKAAIICSNLKGFVTYDVDQLGRIVLNDEVTETLLGGEMTNIIVLNDMINALIREGKLNQTLGGEIEHLTHCVGCCCGKPFVPATVEAEITQKIVCEELNLYKMLEEYQHLGNYELRKVKIGNSERKVLKMPFPEIKETEASEQAV